MQSGASDDTYLSYNLSCFWTCEFQISLSGTSILLLMMQIYYVYYKEDTKHNALCAIWLNFKLKFYRCMNWIRLYLLITVLVHGYVLSS